MFFVFYTLALLNFVSVSNNYVLRKLIHGETEHKKSSNVVLQDTRNSLLHLTTFKSLFIQAENLTNTKCPNLKNNLFEKKLSDEMFLINQNSNEDKEVLKTDKNYTNCPLGTNTDNSKLGVIEEIQHAVDNLEFRHVFRNRKYNVSAHIGNPLELAEELHNQSKDKVVDLRSLSGNIHTDKNIPRQFGSGCSRSDNYNWALNYYPILSMPTTRDCGACSRTTLTYTLMPVYVPFEPDEHNMHTTTSRVWSTEDQDDNSNDINDIDYKDKPKDLDWNTVFFEGRPNKLVNDVVDDLLSFYPDSVVKKCYCSSSAVLFYGSIFYIVLLNILCLKII